MDWIRRGTRSISWACTFSRSRSGTLEGEARSPPQRETVLFFYNPNLGISDDIVENADRYGVNAKRFDRFGQQDIFLIDGETFGVEGLLDILSGYRTI